ncbi:MAG: SxtJ family membrane protein [Acidobacteriota bacterium]
MGGRKPSEAKQARQFGLAIIVVLAVLAAALKVLGGPSARAVLALSAAAAVVICLMFAFQVWLRLFRIWMAIAGLMGKIMTAVILTVFFYAVFSPMVLVFRMLGKRPLDLSWRDRRSTYWVNRTEAEPSMERYRRAF